MEARFCDQCGYGIDGSARFCGGCGRLLTAHDEAETSDEEGQLTDAERSELAEEWAHYLSLGHVRERLEEAKAARDLVLEWQYTRGAGLGLDAAIARWPSVEGAVRAKLARIPGDHPVMGSFDDYLSMSSEVLGQYSQFFDVVKETAQTMFGVTVDDVLETDLSRQEMARLAGLDELLSVRSVLVDSSVGMWEGIVDMVHPES